MISRGPGTLADARPRLDDPVAAAWAAFLGRWPWAWFATCTWRPTRPDGSRRPPMGPERRARAWREHVALAELELVAPVLGRKGAVNWRRHGGEAAWWVRADEPHKSGAFHLHGLVGWPSEVTAETLAAFAVQEPSRWDAMQRWAAEHGWARIEAPALEDAVARYVSKYVVKGSRGEVGEIDIGGALGEHAVHW